MRTKKEQEQFEEDVSGWFWLFVILFGGVALLIYI